MEQKNVEVPEAMKGTDCGLVLAYLADRQPHHVVHIIHACKGYGCTNWAVRSRVSNLNTRGYHIINIREKKYRDEYPIPVSISNCFKPEDQQAIYQLINVAGEGTTTATPAI